MTPPVVGAKFQCAPAGLLGQRLPYPAMPTMILLERDVQSISPSHLTRARRGGKVYNTIRVTHLLSEMLSDPLLSYNTLIRYAPEPCVVLVIRLPLPNSA